MAAFFNEELIEVGGHRLLLMVDFRVLDLIEHLCGQPMPAVLGRMSGGQTGALSRAAWAMLRKHHPEMSLDAVGGLFLGLHRSAIADVVFALLSRCMNLGDKADGKDTKRAEWSVRDFLVEWCRLGGSPSEFWHQTPASFVACMEGMAGSATRELDLAMVNAWHTAIFALLGYAGKLRDKKLSDFLSSRKEPEEEDFRLHNAKLLHGFQSLKARGLPIDISVTKH